jgi:predicted nucleotidyltransferase component of viral defense system
MTNLRHHLDKELFLESIKYTAAQTGFLTSLVEKDYFCSVLLNIISERDFPYLIFKGGTCLNKIYTRFYRLSEDLDFSIHIPPNTSRSERRTAIQCIKYFINSIENNSSDFKLISEMKGANQSTQYISTVGYKSLITGEMSSLKFEIALREPILTKEEMGKAHTLIINPFTEEAIVEPINIKCLSLIEAYSEKTRAALSRRIPEIRDYFDIFYAETNSIINFDSEPFIDLVRHKLKFSKDLVHDFSKEKIRFLKLQSPTRLAPVLRQKDYQTFNLDKAIKLLNQIKKKL